MGKLRSDIRAEGYIDVMIFTLAMITVTAFILEFLPVYVTKYRLDAMASGIVRAAEISGGTDNAYVAAAINRHRAAAGINPSVTWERGAARTQLGDEVAVRLDATATISIFRVGVFRIPLTARASGISEVYHK